MRLELSNHASADEDDDTHSGYGHYSAGTPAPAFLSASPFLTELRELGLAGHDIGDEGVFALLNSPSWKPLSRLDLSYNRITDAGLEALARSPHMAGLKRLDLLGNEITDRGLEALANSPYITGLNHLNLANNSCSEKGLAALLRSPNVARMRDINLAHSTEVPGEAIVKAIAESPYLTRLNFLTLSDQVVTLESAKRLVASPVLRSLVYIGGIIHDRVNGLVGDEEELVNLLHARWVGMPCYEGLYD